MKRRATNNSIGPTLRTMPPGIIRQISSQLPPGNAASLFRTSRAFWPIKGARPSRSPVHEGYLDTVSTTVKNALQLLIKFVDTLTDPLIIDERKRKIVYLYIDVPVRGLPGGIQIKILHETGLRFHIQIEYTESGNYHCFSLYYYPAINKFILKGGNTNLRANHGTGFAIVVGAIQKLGLSYALIDYFSPILTYNDIEYRLKHGHLPGSTKVQMRPAKSLITVLQGFRDVANLMRLTNASHGYSWNSATHLNFTSVEVSVPVEGKIALSMKTYPDIPDKNLITIEFLAKSLYSNKDRWATIRTLEYNRSLSSWAIGGYQRQLTWTGGEMRESPRHPFAESVISRAIRKTFHV
jgi:hypothetical protein